MRLAELAVRLDYKRDESYTPSLLSIRAGTSDLDLKEIRAVQMHEPVGWLVVALQPPGMTYDPALPIHNVGTDNQAVLY